MAIKWVRVKDKRTGHEYTLAERAVREEHHEILDKPAVKRNGKPLPATPKRNLEPATAGATATTTTSGSGSRSRTGSQSADEKQKENS